MERKYILEDWPGPWEKWAKNFCYRNHWRVAHILGDYEDCLSKCALDYVICRQRYGDTVNSPQQFMFMYKLWVTAEFNTLSSKDYNERQMHLALPKNEILVDSDAELVARLSTASSELKSVIGIFMNSPQEIMELLRKEASSCHPKQFWKSVLKICGISPSKSSGLASELQKLLSK